jgi:hypothetical protein
MQSGVLAIPKTRPTDVYEVACVHFAVWADVEAVEVVAAAGDASMVDTVDGCGF